MTNIRLTAAELGALVASSGRPEPRDLPLAFGLPINPIAFPADWSAEIQVTTRWLTDRTDSIRADMPERWALADRPLRTINMQVVGAGKAEVHRLIQAAQGSTDHNGYPVPLFCDSVPATSADGSVVYGDFRFRRFFEGGRVVVLAAQTQAGNRTDNEVFFAKILVVSPDYVILDSVPRVVTASDFVVPCIDVETSATVNVEALTDSVVRVSFQWSEVAGVSTLPPLWPSAVVRGPDVLGPLCRVVDGLPVFPFLPEWSEPVKIQAVREMGNIPAPRGSIPETFGLPYLTFEMGVGAASRQQAWRVLRFFDAMQGRAGKFYLIHPLRPFTPHSTLVIPGSFDRCFVAAVGDREAVARYVRKIAFFRADGSFVTREKINTTDNGTYFTLWLDAPLPDANFVDAQPVFVCGFDQDSIEELWVTDEVVPRIELKIREDRQAGPVPLPGGASLQYPLSFPAFLRIEGLNLLLRAGAGCETLEGAPTAAWPAKSDVAVWRDVVEGPPRQSRPYSFPRDMEALAPGPHLIRYPGFFENNKQAAILSPGFRLPMQTSVESPPRQRNLWGEDGWTAVICITPTNTPYSPQIDRFLIRLQSSAGDVFGLLLDSDPARGWASRAGIIGRDASSTPFAAGLSLSPFNYSPASLFFTVRVDTAADLLHVWINGAQALPAALSVPGGLLTPSIYTASEWFKDISDPVIPSSLNLAGLFGTHPCANLVASYNKPLDLSDLHDLHRIVSDLFRTDLSISSLY